MLKALVLLFVSANAFAVQTQKCLKTFRVEVPEVQVFSRSFIYEQVMEKDWADLKSIDAFLAGEHKSLEWDAVLVSRANSTCHYELSSL